MTAIKVITRFAAVFLLCSFASFGVAGGERATQFVNVKIFDGIEDTLHSQEVLVSGGMITAIGDGLVVPDDTVTIDGGGRTLMPGLLDSHTHLMINDAPHVSIYEKPRDCGGSSHTTDGALHFADFGPRRSGDEHIQAVAILHWHTRQGRSHGLGICRRWRARGSKGRA